VALSCIGVGAVGVVFVAGGAPPHEADASTSSAEAMKRQLGDITKEATALGGDALLSQ
jgi:hypothetical protein